MKLLFYVATVHFFRFDLFIFSSVKNVKCHGCAIQMLTYQWITENIAQHLTGLQFSHSIRSDSCHEPNKELFTICLYFVPASVMEEGKCARPCSVLIGEDEGRAGWRTGSKQPPGAPAGSVPSSLSLPWLLTSPRCPERAIRASELANSASPCADAKPRHCTACLSNNLCNSI